MTSPITRRGFIKGASAMALPLIWTPSSLSAAPKARDYSNLRAAVIGCGAAANILHWALYTNAKVQVTALCDADLRRLDPVKPYASHPENSLPVKYPNARRFSDYRELFDQHADSFDIVVCATGDLHHYPVIQRAYAAGKPIYCEKPLTWSVQEALDVLELANGNDMATQMGNQGMSKMHWREADAYLHGGHLGELTEVHGWIFGQQEQPMRGPGADYPEQAQAIPDGLDWDLWTGPAGPASKVPFEEEAYHPKNWRQWLALGTGGFGDWGAHTFGPLYRSLNLGFPKRVEVVKQSEFNGVRYPHSIVVKWTFAPQPLAPHGLEMYFHHSDWKNPESFPPRPEDLDKNRSWPPSDHGCTWVGSKASYVFNEGHCFSGYLASSGLRKEIGRIKHRREIASLGRDHHLDFLAATAGYEAPDYPISNFKEGAKLTAVLHMGTAALRAGEAIDIDTETGLPLNDKYLSLFSRQNPAADWYL